MVFQVNCQIWRSYNWKGDLDIIWARLQGRLQSNPSHVPCFCNTLSCFCKHSIGHTFGMVGPIYMTWKGSASNGCWATCVTLIFDLTHDLDLGFSRSNFEIAISMECNGHSMNWIKGMQVDGKLDQLCDFEPMTSTWQPLPLLNELNHYSFTPTHPTTLNQKFCLM